MKGLVSTIYVRPQNDQEVSSSWFGRYASGEPIHRGYEPERMVEAGGRDWDRVFLDDPHRRVFSIYGEEDQHVGECQVAIDDNRGAELSVLIGRKDLWHRGYGTATVVSLLDQVFNSHHLERAWVNVPHDNTPALGLFRKLGFVYQETRMQSTRANGFVPYGSIMAITAREFRRARPRKEGSGTVVTITGLPASGSEIVGAEIARLTGLRLAGAEIPERMCRRLNCTTGELVAIEAMCQSFWARLLANVSAGPWDDAGFFYRGQYWFPTYYSEVPNTVTKEQYLEALRGVIEGLCLEGDVVIHGYSAHLFVPSRVSALSVFVTAPDELRQQRIVTDWELDTESAEKWLKRADKGALALSKNLFGADFVDPRQYDMNLNLGRWSYAAAAEAAVGALGSETVTTPQEVDAVDLVSSTT